MKKKRIIAGFRGVFLLLLFTGYYICNNFFYHVHYYGGHQVVHSHPFASAEHTHSSKTLSLLYIYNHMLMQKSEDLVFIPQQLKVIYEVYVCNVYELDSPHYTHTDPRAPPFAA